MGLSNELSCEAGSFSHYPLNPHRCFQSEALRLYFPVLEPWVTLSVLLPSCSSLFILMQMWDCPVHQPPPCPPPGPLASAWPRILSTLLWVWMNVCSLTPWLSDFHTVRVFVSSGCFLFLNLCCPSFCCAKRHSVSTYPSICLEVHCVYINAQRITILFLISIKYSVVCNIHNLCIIPY